MVAAAWTASALLAGYLMAPWFGAPAAERLEGGSGAATATPLTTARTIAHTPSSAPLPADGPPPLAEQPGGAAARTSPSLKIGLYFSDMSVIAGPVVRAGV